jgi:hypothetical protein
MNEITIITTSNKGFNNTNKTQSKHQYSKPITVGMLKDLLDMEDSGSRIDEIVINQTEEKQ